MKIKILFLSFFILFKSNGQVSDFFKAVETNDYANVQRLINSPNVSEEDYFAFFNFIPDRKKRITDEEIKNFLLIMELFVKKGVNFKKELNYFKKTAPQICLEYEFAPCLRFFLRKKIDIGKIKGFQFRRLKDPSIVRILREFGKTDDLESEYLKERRKYLAKKFLGLSDVDDFKSVTLRSVANFDLDMVKRLSSLSYPINFLVPLEKNKNGKIIKASDCPVKVALSNGDDDVFSFLIQQSGFDINNDCIHKDELFFRSIDKCMPNSLKILVGKIDYKQINLQHTVSKVLASLVNEKKGGELGFIKSSKCYETLKVILSEGFKFNDSRDYFKTLAFDDFELAKIAFTNSDGIAPYQLRNLEVQLQSLSDTRNKNSYWVDPALIVKNFENLKQTVLKENSYYRNEVDLDKNIPLFYKNEIYVICGKYGPILTYSDINLKNKTGVIDHCLHLRGGNYGENYQVFTFLGFEKKVAIFELKKNNSEKKSKKNELEKVYISIEGLVTPVELIAPGGPRIPLPIKSIKRKIQIKNGSISTAYGDPKLRFCTTKDDFSLEIKNDGYVDKESSIILPKSIDLSELKVKSFIIPSEQQTECGT